MIECLDIMASGARTHLVLLILLPKLLMRTIDRTQGGGNIGFLLSTD